MRISFMILTLVLHAGCVKENSENSPLEQSVGFAVTGKQSAKSASLGSNQEIGKDFKADVIQRLSDELIDETAKLNTAYVDQVEREINEHYEKNCSELEELLQPMSYNINDIASKAEFDRKVALRKHLTKQCFNEGDNLLRKHGKAVPKYVDSIIRK